jgi:Ca2+-transporting ATPase
MARKGNVLGINERMHEEPFDSVKKYMSTTHVTSKGEITYIKGACENILELCDFYYFNGKEIKLTKSTREKILGINGEMASQALRVLAIAYKKNHKTVFSGLCGMIDPPRKEVKNAIKLCINAGIRVIMITGDHRITAEAVAQKVGITGKVLEGKELEKLSDKEFDKLADEVNIYARVNPEHKVRILKALQEKGNVVAMTGDGVNDAPALKSADVGVAMSIKGTDVARSASDMVLLDDNFATIVSAVKEGRVIYDNIKKFVKFLLSANLGELLIIVISLVLSLPLPLLPLQILWINLITDGLPALALSVDNPEKGIMQRKPRIKGESILKGIIFYIIGAGILSTAAGLIGFYDYLGDLNKARTIVLSVLIMFELFWVFSCRSDKYTIFELGNNKWLYLAVGFAVLIHLGMMYSHFSSLFDVVALNLNDWLKVIGLSCVGFVVFEGKKLLIRK